MSVPKFDEDNPPSGIREWAAEGPDGGYESNLNDTQKLVSPEQWEYFQGAMGRLARARRQVPPDDVVVG